MYSYQLDWPPKVEGLSLFLGLSLWHLRVGVTVLRLGGLGKLLCYQLGRYNLN